MKDAHPNPPLDPATLDLCQMAHLLGLAANQRVMDDLKAAGFRGLRQAHGFVFQHLLGGPRSITDLARRLGVTQQAASKVVAELRTRGFVENAAGPDARARYVQLSRRGRASVDRTRAQRADMEALLRRRLGAAAVSRAHTLLWEALGLLGGQDAVRTRSVKAGA